MTYAATISGDAPVGWWKLNEASGTTATDSGSGTAANGTYSGSNFLYSRPGIDSLDAGGGTSIFFGGTDAYVDIGAAPTKLCFASGTSFSLEAWVSFNSILTTPGAAVITEGYSGDGNVRYMLGFHNGGTNTRKPTFGWFNGSWRLVVSGNELTDSSWHHLVGTYDGGTNQLELWVDGVSQGTLTPGGTQPTGTENIYIGRRWDNGNDIYFNGWIDEPAMYNVKLTSTQIGNHYAARNASTSDVRATQQFIDLPLKSANPNAQVTQELIESVLKHVNPSARTTQLYIEMVVKRHALSAVYSLDAYIADHPAAVASSTGAQAKWERINWW